MAHEITETDKMFSTRMPTWHGLGEILEDYPTREEAQKIAHPWDPIEEPLYHQNISMDGEGELLTTFQEVPGYKSITRSDNGEVLGVASSSYQIVSNDEMWDIAEAIQGSGVDVKYETAGTLKGGKRVWILLKLQDPISIKGDPNGDTLPYYSLQNAHDGSGAFRGQATVTRIVCANTAQIADMDSQARGTTFTFNHTKNVSERIEEAQGALQGWRESLDEWVEFQEHLLKLEITPDAQEAFLEGFFPMPVADIISDRVKENIHQARQDFKGLLGTATCEGIDTTAAGLVAAATEYAEHIRRAHSQESRFTRTFLDRNEVVQHATKLALEVATV